MKKLIVLALLLLPALVSKAQQTAPKAEEPQMKQYIFVMLKRGPNRSQDAESVKNYRKLTSHIWIKWPKWVN